jgi:hypothetical protein
MKSNQLFTTLSAFGALVIFCSASAFAAPSVRTYSYSARVPATGASCTTAAQDLAQKIQAAAPTAKNVQGICVARANFKDHGEQFAVDSLKVTYDSSDFPVALTSIQFPSFEYNELHAYPKYRDCLNDLEAQSALFTQATGLSVLAGSCSPNADSYSGFVLKIEAAGKPARTMRVMHNLASVRLDTNSAWKTQVQNLISKVGGIIAKTGNDVIAYYAPSNVTVDSKHWLRTDTAEQCQSQVDEVTSMLHKLGAKNIVAVCNADYAPTDGARIHYYLDTAVDTSLLTAFTSTYHDTFFSFEECMAVRQSILDREPAAKAWFGSFCTASDYGDDRYNFQIVTRF